MQMNDSEQKKSYGRILESTALVGGSQVASVLLGIVRNKALAILVGTTGIGLIGIYSTLTGTIGTATGLGISYSGVRQIAEATGSGDEERIARTAITLRRMSLLLGFLGTVLMVVFCVPLSRLTFGNGGHAGAIAVLSLTVFMAAVSGGQGALVRGMSRIADLAYITVLGAVLGTICSIPLVYFWGEKGIVPFIVTVSAMTILTSWWFARKIPLAKAHLSWRQTRAVARGLLSLGLFFMSSSLMSFCVSYLVRVLLIRKIGLQGVGMYQAAFSLSIFYIGVIINAMGMDFYPRLTTVAGDNATCNRLVNEQTEVSLLLATPAVIATLTFAPLVIRLFYSAQFIPAYDVLRWQMLGAFLRVVAWPIAIVLQAKGKGQAFFWTELAANVAHAGFIWTGISLFGLEGAGMAFFIFYIFYTLMILTVVHRLSGFLWSPANLQLGFILSFCVTVSFLLPYFVHQRTATALGAALTLGMSAYCLRTLYLLVGLQWFADFHGKLQARLYFRK